MRTNRINFIAITICVSGQLRAFAFDDDADTAEAVEPTVRVLFLGDEGHHTPRIRFEELQPVMAERRIQLDYTGEVTDLHPDVLADYDGLMVYANIDEIAPEQEQALLDFVASGHGFIPLHCASYCFRNSQAYVALVGAQFESHTTGEFRTHLANTDHPLMEGFQGFESWDETYVHAQHNQDRTVLEYRVDFERREPWTWVREHGEGRVFYTAWGHDDRTWKHPGFHNLIERGIRWACNANLSVIPPYSDSGSFPVPQLTAIPEDAAPFSYEPAEVPFYPESDEWGTIGEPIHQMQSPMTPADSMTHMATPAQFHVELFASDPDIFKPISMTWDERGRLWLAETIDYPNDMQRLGQGHDQIRICEDTDGDFVADKFTVFADELSIPTSIVHAYGGLIVHQAPVTLFLKDTDGDDVADVRKVLLQGWRTNDTHAGPSNLRYGHDNWYWGIVGYAGFDGTVAGEELSFTQGLYRFKLALGDDGLPEVTKLEFVRSTDNNSWGVGLSEEGLVFGSTANFNPSVYMPIANRYYEQVRGWSASRLECIADSYLFDPITDKVRQVDQHGGYTSAAGHALYTARTYPQEYWNRVAFVCDPTGHLIGSFVLNADGTDFRSYSPFNLLASDDEWAAPIMAEVGPDGNVWIIDWYNFIVQHNPTPAGYETGRGNAYAIPLRDKTHGRIYRIVSNSGGDDRIRDLAGMESLDLVEYLRSSNMLWRLHAQRLLIERGDLSILPDLVDIFNDGGIDATGLAPGPMHVVWTLAGLGAFEGDASPEAMSLLQRAISNSSPAVRRAAAAVWPRDPQSVALLFEGGDGFSSHEDPQVQLQMLLTASEMPASEDAAATLVPLFRDETTLEDRWLPDALTTAAATHDVFVLSALANGEPLPERSQEIVTIVAEHLARRDPGEALQPVLVAMAEADATLLEPFVAGLASGWPDDRTLELDADAEAALIGMLDRLSPAGKGQIVQLARAWGSEAFEEQAAEIAASLLDLIRDDDAGDEERADAAQQLMEFQGQDIDTVQRMLSSITAQSSPELTAAIIDSLRNSSSTETAGELLDAFAGFTPTGKAASLRTLLARPDFTRELLGAIEAGEIAVNDLALDQKQALLSHPDDSVRDLATELLARSGNLPNADRQAVIEEFAAVCEETGDVMAGRAVFVKHCGICHTHSGEGKQIGPDLTGMAVHPKHELLIHILDPSRSVEGNFRLYTIATEEGQIVSGMLASETRTTLELYDSQGKTIVVLREDIEELISSNKSLMPEGVEKTVTREEIVNLLEFLTAKGKYVPMPLGQVATAISTHGMFQPDDNGPDRLIFDDWSVKTFRDVPFLLVDPRDGTTPNVVLLNGPRGYLPPQMPQSVEMPCNTSAVAIHLLSGISGWGFPFEQDESVTMIVRLHYADGGVEDHELINGRHFADYIRRVDVPDSEFAFEVGDQQIRYLSVVPERRDVIERMELIKGDDQTAPIVMAITVQTVE